MKRQHLEGEKLVLLSDRRKWRLPRDEVATRRMRWGVWSENKAEGGHAPIMSHCIALRINASFRITVQKGAVQMTQPHRVVGNPMFRSRDGVFER